MATAVSTPQVVSVRASRWTYLLAYLALVTLAEIFIAIPGPASPVDRPFQPIGLSIHILLVFSLLFLSVFQQTKDSTLAALLVAVSLASLVRVFSLAVPRFPFFASPEISPLNTIPWLALVSIPLLVSVAAVAYVQRLGPRDLGLLLSRAVQALGGRYGLLYVTAIFASLHIFFLSGFDLVFVFGVGLFYGFVALKTKNLWGVILSHSLGNVILYLVAPFH